MRPGPALALPPPTPEGVATPAPGRARGQKEATAVEPRPLRSQSIRMRPRRSAIFTWARYFSGFCVAQPFGEGPAPRRTGSHGCSGRSGTTTCRPLPPLVRQKLGKPIASSLSRMSSAAATISGTVDALAGVEVEDELVGMQRVGLGGAPGVQLDGGHLGHGDQALQVVDGEVGGAVGGAVADAGGHGAVAVLLEEMLAVDALGAAHDRQRAVGQAGQGVVGDRLPVFDEVALGDAGPQRAVGVGQGDALDRLVSGLRRLAVTIALLLRAAAGCA